MANHNQSTRGQSEQHVDAIQSADIELGPTKTVVKKDFDPLLVAFEEPFDAENPRQEFLNIRVTDRSVSKHILDAGPEPENGPSRT